MRLNLLSLFLLAVTYAALTACNSGEDRGTCVGTDSEGVPQCTVSDVRMYCEASGLHKSATFTKEDDAAGLARCKSAGYDVQEDLVEACQDKQGNIQPSARKLFTPSDTAVAKADHCAFTYRKAESVNAK